MYFTHTIKNYIFETFKLLIYFAVPCFKFTVKKKEMVNLKLKEETKKVMIKYQKKIIRIILLCLKKMI